MMPGRRALGEAGNPPLAVEPACGRSPTPDLTVLSRDNVLRVSTLRSSFPPEMMAGEVQSLAASTVLAEPAQVGPLRPACGDPGVVSHVLRNRKHDHVEDRAARDLGD
jgi:hypothetical protein